MVAEDGWVESVDPKTGRTFYANHVTRMTQWEPPPGWNSSKSSGKNSNANNNNSNDLPDGWEEMKDPASGRSFYVNHASQVTTWTRPTNNAAASSRAAAPVAAASSSSSSRALQQAATATTSSMYGHQSSSFAPAPAPTAAVAAAPSRTRRSWSHDASYFRPSSASSSFRSDFDFSDSMSNLEFKVQTVEDRLRPACASCNMEWSLSKRRHHCRLCGDVYCDSCSPHKVELPMEGKEFHKPVRICKFCYPDVEQGNYFSQRRYLTPLTLYDPPDDEHDLEGEDGVATHQTVAAALCALTSDLDALVLNASDVDSRLTMDASILLPAITKHLRIRATSDRAVRALASLLSLGSMIQQSKNNQNEYARALYRFSGDSTLEDILALLERSGSDRRTLYIQEQAAKAIFYLTDTPLLKGLANDQLLTYQVDIPRALRSMLDHASSDKNPNLQRWAATCICHLVVEEERRTTFSANDIASAMAMGRDVGGSVVYQSFLPELVSTGGILILCSLIGADDSDTRAHATGALGATLEATRAIDDSLSTLYDMTGGQVGSPKSSGINTESQIIRAIVSSGGCSQALSQLLQSAENGVARMGCDFCASLVMPLLEDARGTATLDEGYDCSNSMDELGASREAAMSIASGPCLPALLSLMRDPELGGRMIRPMELKKAAMETLAAVAMAVGEMTKANSQSTDEAVSHMLDEGIVPVMLAILQSSSSQSLTTKDTPSSRIREAAGIVISAMAVCSVEAMMELQSCHAITSMLSAMSDPGMAALPSEMRGDGAPKCLGMLQTAAALLTYSQHDETVTESDQIDRLLEAIDAGAIDTLSRILFTKLDWDSEDKAVGAMKARDACCRMLTAIFDIARQSGDTVCHNRLWEVVDADAFRRNPPRSIVAATLSVLQASAIQGRHSLQGGGRGPHFHAAVMDLVESSLYAVGSMCGSTVVPGLEQNVESIEFLEADAAATSREEAAFRQRRREASAVACDILTASKKHLAAVLPAMLVGGFGEKTATASLRLALAIAQNGNLQQHAKLAASGILVPIADFLQNAMNAGDQFRFSACLRLIKDCGPHVNASQLSSIQTAIRIATSVLRVPIDPTAPDFVNTEALKESCVQTLESLSSNASLWSAISKDALPSIVEYLQNHCDYNSNSNVPHAASGILGALRALTKIVTVPSHAVAAARAGLAEALGGILLKYADSLVVSDKDNNHRENDFHYHDDNEEDDDDDDDDGDDEDGEEEVPLMALEVLHVLHQNKEARNQSKIMENSTVLEGLACVLAKSATSKPNPEGDGRADVCIQTLDMFHSIFATAPTLQSQLSSPLVSGLVEVVAREPALIHALCATLLAHKDPSMKLAHFHQRQGNDLKQPPREDFTISNAYGPPLLLVLERCGNYPNTYVAALQFLYRITVLSNAMDTPASATIWNIMMHHTLNDEDSDVDDDGEPLSALAATFCAKFLLTLHQNSLTPHKKSTDFQDFNGITSSLVRYHLLEALKTNLDMEDDYCQSLLVAMQIPSICLSIWNNPHLQTLAFEMISLMVDSSSSSSSNNLVRIFVESKTTLASLFQMLATAPPPEHNQQEEQSDIRAVVAHILGSLAETGLLTQAVERFGLKSVAISGLASACLTTSNTTTATQNDDELATSATLSSRCMECLVDLLKGGGDVETTYITQADAEVIANSLGKKICQMVISRFIERAKLSQYDDEDDDDICSAPDTIMLVAISQHASALKIIAELDGTSALCMVAGEGHVPALRALLCNAESSAVLQADGHLELLKLMADDNIDTSTETRVAAMELLAHLSQVRGGNQAISEAEQECIEVINFALHCIGALEDVVEEEDCLDTSSEEGMEDEEEDEDEDEKDEEEESQEEIDHEEDDENDFEKEDEREEKEENEENEELDEESIVAPVVVTRRKKKQQQSKKEKEDNESWIKPPPLPPPPSSVEETKKMTKKSKPQIREEERENEPEKEMKLKYACISFLSNLVPVPMCLQQLSTHAKLVPTVHELSKIDALRFPSLRFLQTLAPLATTTPILDIDVLGTVFIDTLMDQNGTNMDSKQMASQGLGVTILDLTSTELQEKAMVAISALIQTNVKKCAVQRSLSFSDQRNRTLLAKLTFTLIMIVRQVAGANHLRFILESKDLLVSLVHLVEWRYDARTTEQQQQKKTTKKDDTEQFLYWNGAVSQGLSHLATIFHRLSPTLLSKLQSTVLTIVRPGKAPRKTSDFVISLQRVVQPHPPQDSSAVLAAQQILANLQRQQG